MNRLSEDFVARVRDMTVGTDLSPLPTVVF